MIPKELSINSVEQVYKNIKPFINVTPLIKANKIIDETFKTNIFLKFECFQKSGSFKARGATNNILSSNKKDLQNGITAVSAGNHAIAASYVSNIFKLKNKIFLYESANSYRVIYVKIMELIFYLQMLIMLLMKLGMQKKRAINLYIHLMANILCKDQLL